MSGGIVGKPMSEQDTPLSKKTDRQAVDAFVDRLRKTPAPVGSGQQGRLIFALDATASRAHTWDQACHLQAEMFEVAAAQGGLRIQLAYYRGYREFTATPWCGNADALLDRMTTVRCRGGLTQIGRLLRHTLDTSRAERVNALVFVGDCVEEPIDGLCDLAGQLGLMRTPAFMFQEGQHPAAHTAFGEIARLSGGAYCPFDAGSADQLRQLLKAVAAYASGGTGALKLLHGRGNPMAHRLLEQLPGK
jgi:hypothetical protein